MIHQGNRVEEEALVVSANVWNRDRAASAGNSSDGGRRICFLVETCRYPLAVRGRTVFYPVAPFFADPAARERGGRKRRFHAPAKTSSTLHTGVAPAVNVTRHPWLRLLTRRYSHFGARRGPNRPIFRADRSQKLSNDSVGQPSPEIKNQFLHTFHDAFSRMDVKLLVVQVEDLIVFYWWWLTRKRKFEKI